MRTCLPLTMRTRARRQQRQQQAAVRIQRQHMAGAAHSLRRQGHQPRRMQLTMHHGQSRSCVASSQVCTAGGLLQAPLLRPLSQLLLSHTAQALLLRGLRMRGLEPAAHCAS